MTICAWQVAFCTSFARRHTSSCCIENHTNRHKIQAVQILCFIQSMGGMPESICTIVLLCLMALLLLMLCSGPPTVHTGQQQVILLTKGVIHLPLLLADLKHSCQLCLQQHQADCEHGLAACSALKVSSLSAGCCASVVAHAGVVALQEAWLVVCLTSWWRRSSDQSVAAA